MKLKSILSSLLTSVFLPLIPCIISVLIKVIFWGRISFTMFEPSEIAFSVAMYLMMCIIASKNLPDKELANSLFTLYLFLLVLLISLFSLSIFFNAYNEYHIYETINALNDTINALKEGRDTIAIFDNKMKPILDRIRVLTVVSSGFAIIFSEIARGKYKIRV